MFQGNPQVGALRTSMGDIMHHAKPAAIYADLKACDDAGSMAEVAARITKPLLVISGDQDKMARASEGAKLANMAEHGEYALIADCGHMMMIEKPVETALYIKRFIDGLSGESI